MTTTKYAIGARFGGLAVVVLGAAVAWNGDWLVGGILAIVAGLALFGWSFVAD